MTHLRVCKPYQCEPFRGGRVKGVFIGINYTGTSAELRGCVNDVRTMLATLERIGFPLEEAVILVDDPAFPNVAAPPTRSNIEAALQWLSAGANPGDTLFLHFSGHGSQQKNRNGTEADGFDETMVPLDYTSAGQIVDDDIFRMVVRPLPIGARLTAVMDCCHSGTLMDLQYEFTATRENMNTYANDPLCGFKNANPRNVSGGDVMLFSGCADDQTSADVVGGNFQTPGSHPGSAGGACTGALSEVLTTTHGLTFVDLLLGLRQSLKRRGYKQLPQLSATKPIDLSRAFSLFGPLAAVKGHEGGAPPPTHGAGLYPPNGAQGGLYPPPQPGTGLSPLAPHGGGGSPYPQQGSPYPPPHGGSPDPPPQGQYPPPQQGPYPPQSQYPPPQQQGSAYPPPQGSPYPQSQYPPPQSQYPPPPQQGSPYPPPQGQYPPPQGQYPPPQGQYPPPQGSTYPPPQGQYPPPQQGQYPPPQGQYPPPQGYYPLPQGQYPPPPQQQGGNPYYGGTAALGTSSPPAWQQGKYANPFSTFGR